MYYTHQDSDKQPGINKQRASRRPLHRRRHCLGEVVVGGLEDAEDLDVLLEGNG
jgi:hypothetical protein